MTLRQDLRFPNVRRYVLKLRGDLSIGSAPLAGRLEHLVTGQKFDFDCGRELLDYLAGEHGGAASDNKDQT